MNSNKIFTTSLITTLVLFGCSITTDKTNIDDATIYTNEIVTEVIPTEVPLIEPNRDTTTCTVISQIAPVSNFPDDIPLYANSNQTEADCTTHDTYYSLRYKTTDDLADVTDNLIMLLEQHGWGEIEVKDTSAEYNSYDYYVLIYAKRPGGKYGRTVIYDVRDDLRVPGAGEIMIREQYEN